MKKELYLETFTSKSEYWNTSTLKLSLESLITYCVYKYCNPDDLKLYFVCSKDTTSNILLDLKVDLAEFTDKENIPWQVASCLYPVVLFDDTSITGLCAVSRLICKHKKSPKTAQEHEDGLLSFRQGCLQAPNEVSIWTKFCEVDLIKTAKQLLSIEHIKKLPETLIRFENHLNKPVKIHNVFKVARDLKKEMNLKENIEKAQNVKEESKSNERVPKQRKWKSGKKEQEINSSTKIEDLDLSHQFAEGPFLTLADLILLPTYHIVINTLDKEIFKSLLPLTYKWFINVNSISQFLNIKLMLESIQLNSVLIETLELPEVEDVSLYKSDPKRHNPKKRLFTKPEDIERALNVLEDGMELNVSDLKYDKNVDWDLIPDGANPAAGHLPDERVVRKSQQLENLCQAVLAIAKSGNHIVDFCSGSGHLGILIAYLLPECTVILLENKEQSLLRARERVHKMGLKNVFFFQCNLDFFIGKFDIGIALHACGIASDLVLDKCLIANAKFVLCPCCYGSLHATDRLAYPRSSIFRNMSIDQYLCIGHTADQTHKEHPLTVRGARCMAIIDSDRARLAEEFGYKVTLSRLKPLSCTDKNNLLVGIPA